MCEIWRILGSNHPVCFVVVWKPSTSLKCSDVEALCPCPSVDIHVSQCCYDAHWYVCFGAVSLFSSIFRGRARDVLSCVCALADTFTLATYEYLSTVEMHKIIIRSQSRFKHSHNLFAFIQCLNVKNVLFLLNLWQVRSQRNIQICVGAAADPERAVVMYETALQAEIIILCG